MAVKLNTLMVTGGAGFIGSNFILHWLKHYPANLINIDKLTYAGNLDNLRSIENEKAYKFIHGDIGDVALLSQVLSQYQPDAIINFAAESHVDRSIDEPADFIETNINGTFRLLEAVRRYAQSNKPPIFLHISTDEVFGSLAKDDEPFSESSPFQPNSPYSASKAASDHIVRSHFRTYDLPCMVTHCSNNYGPYQFPEKFIPLMILNGMQAKSLPIYGDGHNIRDWLHVNDHATAICKVLLEGEIGESYNIGGGCELSNRDVVQQIVALLDEFYPQQKHAELIEFVADRPGHDKRYAINCNKIQSTLNWQPQIKFEQGLRDTVQWYRAKPEWIKRIQTGEYKT